MIAARLNPRRGIERFLAILSAILLFASMMVAFAPAALAHHPEISAGQVCADSAVRISYESVSWKTDGTSGSAHNDIRIEVQVNGSGPWTQVASGAYNAGNNYRFSGTFDAAGYAGQSIVVRARANGAWTNGQGGGETRTTSPILVNLVCTQGVTVTPSPQACVPNQQGAPRGGVSFNIDPSSGATVRVYTNANFTGQVGGVLGDDQALSLSPGTYYWRATASQGHTINGASSGQFTIAPCTATVSVSPGACAVTGTGAPRGSVTVSIDPASGATVVITGPGGPFAFSGSGGSAQLAPGSYNWTASSATGFVIGGAASGQFTIDPCTSSVSVTATSCQVVDGRPAGSVTVGIDPDSGASVVVTGPGGPYDFSGDGGTATLAPGSYSWSATAAAGFTLTGPASGQFTVSPCTTSVSVTPGACSVVGGTPAGSVTVGIDPSTGATVVITGPGGPYLFSGSGGSVALSPGSYSWQATADSGFDLTGPDSGSFEVLPCDATVTVSGSCELEGARGQGVIEVAMTGDTTVQVFQGTTLVDTLTASGTIFVPEGKTYTWSATAGSGFEIDGPDSGTIVIAKCSPPDEVLDEEIENDDDTSSESETETETEDPDELPFTGIDTGSLLAVGAVLFGSGWVLVRSARRLEGRD